MRQLTRLCTISKRRAPPSSLLWSLLVALSLGHLVSPASYCQSNFLGRIPHKIQQNNLYHELPAPDYINEVLTAIPDSFEALGVWHWGEFWGVAAQSHYAYVGNGS